MPRPPLLTTRAAGKAPTPKPIPLSGQHLKALPRLQQKLRHRQSPPKRRQQLKIRNLLAALIPVRLPRHPLMRQTRSCQTR